jgi:hypothetical protein
MINQEETTAAVAAKSAIPVGVSLATFMGYPVSDLLVWLTLIYTFLLIVHKLYLMYCDFRKK